MLNHGVLAAWEVRESIREATEQVSNAKSVGMQADVRKLERRLDRLALACEALYELMNEHLGVSEEQFLAKVDAIDLRDGRRDGRAKSAGARACPRCGKVLTQGVPRCLYCGQEVMLAPFEH